MKEISKAEFVRRIISGKSLFLGISSVMETDGGVGKATQRRIEQHESHPRTCTAKSNNHLVFEGGSHLELKDVKPHTFYKCYETDNGILVVKQKWLDIDWNGNVDEVRYKHLYYKMM